MSQDSDVDAWSASMRVRPYTLALAASSLPATHLLFIAIELQDLGYQEEKNILLHLAQDLVRNVRDVPSEAPSYESALKGIMDPEAPEKDREVIYYGLRRVVSRLSQCLPTGSVGAERIDGVLQAMQKGPTT